MIFQKFFSKTLVLTNSKNLEDLNPVKLLEPWRQSLQMTTPPATVVNMKLTR